MSYILNLEPTDYVGALGAMFLIFIPLPQIWRTYRTGSAGGLSLWYLLVQIITNGLFTAYGFLKDDLFIWIPNVSMVICNLILILLKYIYRDNNQNTGISV
jgi:uncharacterized protein with PQ loop repeat